MKKIVEFFDDMQGRPTSKVRTQLSQRLPVVPEWSIRGVMLAGEFSETSETDNYTASNEMVILVNASARPVHVSLPQASTSPSKVYYVKKIDAGQNPVVLKPYQGEAIDNEESVSIIVPYTCLTVICDGTGWWII